MIEVQSPTGKLYLVGEIVAEDNCFTMYACTAGENSVCILKIAKEIGSNGLLDQEAYLLGNLAAEAASLEKEYGEIKTSDKMLNYQIYFPELLETFISKEQDNRRISVLSLKHMATELNKLIPISTLPLEQKVRVDPRTSAWILGKLLKLLVFTHSQNISSDLSMDNTLINPEQHYISLFDWTKAFTHNGGLSMDNAAEEIATVAKNTVVLLGGNPRTGELLEDKQLVDDRYQNFITALLECRERNAQETHKKFYALIRELWPREFYQFTTYKLH